MKVSILMCSYNAALFIDRTVQSILSQTWQDWELLISDDCSTDDTVGRLQPYLCDDRIRLYAQPRNLGYVKNKNWLFGQAAGELVTQIDCDDTSDPTRIAKQVQVFLEKPEIMICGTNYNRINVNDELHEPTLGYNEDFAITSLQLEYPFWFPNLMFRREVIAEFGLFSEYFENIYGDDHHWAFRVNEKYPIWFLAEPLYNYRIHAQSITRLVAAKSGRKSIVAEILEELYRQHQATGTDLIESGREEEMLSFERKLLRDRELMSEKTRVLAAVAVDNGDMKSASTLLWRAIRLDPANARNLKTFAYFIKRRYLASQTRVIKQFVLLCGCKGLHFMRTDAVTVLMTEDYLFTGI
jgi:glycosyltransferase involved in cell wall biosynthesis